MSVISNQLNSDPAKDTEPVKMPSSIYKIYTLNHEAMFEWLDDPQNLTGDLNNFSLVRTLLTQGGMRRLWFERCQKEIKDSFESLKSWWPQPVWPDLSINTPLKILTYLTFPEPLINNNKPLNINPFLFSSLVSISKKQDLRG